MLTYSYKCQKCHQEFEIRAALTEKEESSPDKFKCPHCGSIKITQIIAACNFIKSSRGEASQANSCPTGTCSFV